MKGPPANAGDSVSIPGPGRSPGGGRGNPLQRSRLENPSHGQRSLVGLWPTGPPKIRPGCFRSGWFLSGIAVTCNVPLHLCAVHISICLELRSSRRPSSSPPAPGNPILWTLYLYPEGSPLPVSILPGTVEFLIMCLGFWSLPVSRWLPVSWGVPFLAVAVRNDTLFFSLIFFPPCLFPCIPPFLFSPSLHPCIVPVSFHLPLPPSGPRRASSTSPLSRSSAPLRGPCISDARPVQSLQAPVPTQGASSTLQPGARAPLRDPPPADGRRTFHTASHYWPASPLWRHRCLHGGNLLAPAGTSTRKDAPTSLHPSCPRSPSPPGPRLRDTFMTVAVC